MKHLNKIVYVITVQSESRVGTVSVWTNIKKAKAEYEKLGKEAESQEYNSTYYYFDVVRISK